MSKFRPNRPPSGYRRGPKYFGYWRPAIKESCDDAALFDPAEFVDQSWDPDERSKVLVYLKAGHAESMEPGQTTCRFGCASSIWLGSANLTEGTWIWPEGLYHYVETHGVVPTAEFLEHIRRNNYEVPGEIDLNTLDSI